MPAAVRIENLHFRYPVFDPDATGVGGQEPGYALAGIDLELGEGELLGISGTTGSGSDSGARSAEPTRPLAIERSVGSSATVTDQVPSPPAPPARRTT